MPTRAAETLSVTIARPWEAVYALASDPARLGDWAPGLGSGFAPDGDGWTFRDGGGRPARLAMAPPNAFGVLDHDVTGADGATVHVAMRVVPNGDGAEVTFLLLAAPDLPPEDLARDRAAVLADLRRLRDLCERA